MRNYRLRPASAGGYVPTLMEAPVPDPAPGEILVRVRAASLNYRDLMVLNGGYARNDTPEVVPLSDAAGDVVALGAGVTEWSEGDRVAINFMRDWPSGPVTEKALQSGHGGGVDGVLAEYVSVPAHALAALPERLSYAAAATLPCAGVTAWHGLQRCGVGPGTRVVLLGTGGVSIFALQLAKAMGAEILITSSSSEKLAKAKALGADHLVNYADEPDWDQAVRRVWADGADAVVETGGPGTLERSLASCRPGGQIALIGVLTEGTPAVVPILLSALTVHGIYVGSTDMLRQVVRAVTTTGIEPVIDRRFAFEEAAAAYDYLRSQRHLGKVVIDVA